MIANSRSRPINSLHNKLEFQWNLIFQSQERREKVPRTLTTLFAGMVINYQPVWCNYYLIGAQPVVAVKSKWDSVRTSSRAPLTAMHAHPSTPWKRTKWAVKNAQRHTKNDDKQMKNWLEQNNWLGKRRQQQKPCFTLSPVRSVSTSVGGFSLFIHSLFDWSEVICAAVCTVALTASYNVRPCRYIRQLCTHYNLRQVEKSVIWNSKRKIIIISTALHKQCEWRQSREC